MTIVVKVGGEVVGSGEAALLGADLRELSADHRIAIVHGGGPQATELQKKLGITTTGRSTPDSAASQARKSLNALLAFP